MEDALSVFVHDVNEHSHFLLVNSGLPSPEAQAWLPSALSLPAEPLQLVSPTSHSHLVTLFEG